MLRAIEYAPSGTVSEVERCYKIQQRINYSRRHKISFYQCLLLRLASGRIVRWTKMGAKPYLTHEEEKEPVQLLISWAMVKQGRNEVVKHGTR